jgi:hypothetical protein
MSWLSRKELKERVLNEAGKINLDASLADFAAYVGSKKIGKENGFEKATYNSIREGENITLRYAVDEIKKYGIGRFGIGRGIRSLPNMGVKRTEDLCRILKSQGLIKGRIKRYRDY